MNWYLSAQAIKANHLSKAEGFGLRLWSLIKALFISLSKLLRVSTISFHSQPNNPQQPPARLFRSQHRHQLQSQQTTTSDTFVASFMMGAANSKVSSETDADIRNVRQLCQSFTMECRGAGCGAPLVIDESSHIAQWLSKSKVIPPTSQISELFCVDCDLATCAGCGRQPKIGQANVWTQLGVINHCCNRGRLFGRLYLAS